MKTDHFQLVTKMVVTILLGAIICSGCTRTVYQDREVVRRDSIYITAVSVDTVMQRDSIHIREKGDTVAITVYKNIYKVRERVDTVFKERVDTVLKTVTVEKEVVKKKTNWAACAWSFIVGFMIAILCYVVRRIKGK